MKKTVFILILISVCFYNGLSFANDENKDAENPLLSIVERTLGKDVKILSIEDAEESPVKGLRQVRVWFESVYGETPVLFYMTDDGKMFIAGSIFDSGGNNLTRRDVGNTRPRTIEISRMQPREEYMIGSDNASVKIVMWLGTEVVSLKIFDTLHEIYLKNQDKVALYMKFYPVSKTHFHQDFNRAVALSCFRGEDFLNGIDFLKGVSPAWANERKDVDAFIKERGFEDCDEDIVKQDLVLAGKLNLPAHQAVFVNGTILISDITKENIVKLSGIELK
ncbi:MAG: hypothetical protein IBX72_11940 [Nitrospirae bacterium]|nr:hypothetical protein [Nitrospirota bacterium]